LPQSKPEILKQCLHRRLLCDEEGTSEVGSPLKYSNFIAKSTPFEKYGFLASFVPASDFSTENLSDLAQTVRKRTA
jgi:hypothetical protein